MKKEKKLRGAPMQKELPLNEEKIEDIAEQIHDFLKENNETAALELFQRLLPGDQKEIIRDLPLEIQKKILTTLPSKNVAEIIEHLEPDDVAMISEDINSSILSDILDEVDPDIAADILRKLPEERAEDVLEEMEEADEVKPILEYPDDSAGGRMVLEYVVVHDNSTAAAALDILRREGQEATEIHSVFIADSEERLAGKLSIVHLALASPQTVVRDIMDKDIISVTAETNQEECARIMGNYNLDELPIVNEEKKLVGIIKSQDIVEVAEDEATEDMYKLAGIPGERVAGPLHISMRNRLPWLSINLLTTFIAAAVISLFESTIARVVVLAVFLPVVAGQGGIGGTQTLTLVVRSMALGQISKRGGLRLLGREILLGVIHGLLLGLVVGLVAYLWKGNYMLGVVLGLAMIGNMVIAGLSGAGTPVLLTRLKIDPAVASAVIVTTCTDVAGFFLFLGLATALITFLL